MMKKPIIMGSFCCLAILLVACYFIRLPQPVLDESSVIEVGTQDAKAPNTSAPVASAEQVITEAEQPDILLQLLQEAGYTLKDITTEQIIIVKAHSNTAEIYAFSSDTSGRWSHVLGPINGYVGKNGVTEDKAEGDKMTPVGYFSLSEAFGIRENPGTDLPYRIVTTDSYWVDDPASKFYNQWVEGNAEKDWNSAEHLLDYPEQYAYAVVVDYNRNPIVPGAGSAIFLHCGDNPTAGCIALPEDSMLEILRWLHLEYNPVILIF